MVKNNVLQVIWDPKKTHLQILQRTGEIFKLLLKEDKMDQSYLKLFWSCAKSDHTFQAEVFQIISDASIWLKLKHVEFFFEEMTQQSADKLTVAEFDCLVDLGKYCNDNDFQSKIGDFFWRVVVKGGSKKKLVENCIKKFSEMVKSYDVDKKVALLYKLLSQINEKGNSVPQILELFTKLIKDEKYRIKNQKKPS